MIDKLELLLALAREKHFGRAAETCGITQPALSSSLKSIEEQLGVRIVERGSRFLGFTPEGERVLDWARRIVSDMRAMRQEITTLKRGLTGHLRVGAVPTALPAVPELTQGFAKRNDNVRISVSSMTSDAILAGLDNLELDAGISYIDEALAQRYRVLSLYEERYGLVVAPESAIAERKSIAWAEAGAIPLCLLTPDMQNRRIIDHYLNEAGATPGVRFESNSMMLLHVHVRSGGWATIAALGAGQRFDPPMGLKVIPLIEPAATHQIGVIVRRQEPQPPLVSAFLSMARKLAAPEPAVTIAAARSAARGRAD
jgi:DNA-binding transcriptional LysR family regulator